MSKNGADIVRIQEINAYLCASILLISKINNKI